MNVGILIFPEVEILDFSGPYEVFSVASRVLKRDHGEQDPFEVFLVAETLDVLRARYDYRVSPHYSFDGHPPIDILLIPGGVMDQPRSSPATLQWIISTAPHAKIVSSVCTGAFLLAQAGILDGLQATTHWEDVASLREEFPHVRVLEDRIWVDEGRCVTSAGIAAGIDMCLHLVSRLKGEKVARATARQMDYVPRVQSGCATG
jgi:transcriptional regulator GlxA family with amidase domain